MNTEKNRIPNVQIENIGTGKKPHNVIKGFVELPCWTGYFLAKEPNYVIKNRTVTNGRINLWVDGEITPGGYELSQEQINSYFYLIEHQVIIKHSILEALKKQFPNLLSTEYESWDHESNIFPKLSDLTSSEFDFKNYRGPESINIGEDVKDGIAYIQWHFQCKWDEEHGLDIITHKERVIDIGSEADPWKIYKDNGTYEEEQNRYNNTVVKTPMKKKWWQFW